MLKLFRFSVAASALALTFAFGQSSCPHFLINSPMVVNIEGHFLNQKHSRTSLDVEWRHHPENLDTFFVNLPDRPRFSFVTAGAYRYMEFPEKKIKRQLGTHHLKESIGESPLKLDDMELLANGQFLCKDTTEQPATVLSTAFSMAWWTIIADSIQTPKTVTMKGARKETRTFSIRQWKNYSGELLPTLVKMESNNYNGEIWIRSAYPIKALEVDPLKNNVGKKAGPPPSDLFRKIPVKGERKIPLILKLNQELLRE